jgi:hypothetical protein
MRFAPDLLGYPSLSSATVTARQPNARFMTASIDAMISTARLISRE